MRPRVALEAAGEVRLDLEVRRGILHAVLVERDLDARGDGDVRRLTVWERLHDVEGHVRLEGP